MLTVTIRRGTSQMAEYTFDTESDAFEYAKNQIRMHGGALDGEQGCDDGWYPDEVGGGGAYPDDGGGREAVHWYETTPASEVILRYMISPYRTFDITITEEE